MLKKTNVTARQRYMEHNTPKSDENLKLLAFLGIDIGNKMQNEKISPQKRFPVLLFKIHVGAVFLSTYISIIVGTAFLM